jgi:hypothetical protein
MSRVARKTEGAATFFRVDGADMQSGQETYLVLQAATKPQAEKLARKQGLLISSIRVARPDDWRAAPAQATEPPAAPSTAALEALSPGPVTAPEPPDVFAEVSSLPSRPAAPSLGNTGETEAFDQSTPGPTTPFVEPATASPTESPSQVAEPATTRTAAREAPAPAAPVGGSSAASIVLGFIGAALVIGGVLALVLALWPNNAVGNELDKIDYRLHEVSQTILGCMLVLSGMMTFTLAIICYLIPKRTART